MKAPRILLLCIAAIALLVLGFRFLLGTGGGKDEALGAADAPLAADARADAAPADPADPGPEEAAEPAGALRPAAAPAGALADAPAARTEVEGAGRVLRVVVGAPRDAPPDPELSVVAVAASFRGDDGPRAVLERLRSEGDPRGAAVRAACGPDRTAELRLPAGLEDPRVYVDGVLLHAPEPAELPAEGDELRIDARLGACLVVALDPPAGEEPTGSVQLSGGDFTRRGGWSRHELELDGEGTLAFRAVAADVTWMLTSSLDAHWAAPRMGLELAAGEVREERLEVGLGAAVAGTVTDDAGHPLEGVRVSHAPANDWFGAGGRRSTETDAEGRFELRGIEPGIVELEAELDDWRGARSDELEVGEGELRAGVRIRLDRGLAIAGTVRTSGGAPAAGARVRAETLARSGWGGWGGNRVERAGDATAAADGTFRIGGLDEGSFTLRASLAEDEDDEDDEDALRWRGSVERVRAGTSDVAIELFGPVAFEGRVVDDLGEPVTAFELDVRSTEEGGARESATFQHADGRFRFARVGPGEWRVEAEAEGHTQAEETVVVLPAEGVDLVLRLDRVARVAGRVVGADGAPAPGATVRARDGSGAPGGWGMGWAPAVEADGEGRFRFEDLEPGSYELVAQAADWADSRKLSVELAPGQVRENVLLALRVGGRIEGAVYSDAGDPVAGQNVTYGENAMGFAARGATETDGGGRFAFDHVTPGEWSVSAVPSMAEMSERMRGRRDPSAFAEVMGQMITETVAVADGEVVEVLLGGEPKRPVRVYGVVTTGGEPVPDAQVTAVSEGSAVFEGMKSAMTDADGGYELVVDRPGGFAFSATAGDVGVEALVDVPREDELRVDLAIPTGRIAGTVESADGSPAAGVRLNLQREDGLGRLRWNGDQATADADGRYAFEGLEAGSYTVRANVAGWGTSQDLGSGSAIRDGVVVRADATTDGVDFRLEAAGTVTGTVRGVDGAPAADASVFFRDAAGRVVARVSGTVTDAAGRFERKGLAPGVYTLSARSEGAAAGDEVEVVVQSGRTASVELGLDAGTTVLVSLEGADGAQLRARVEVLDEEGREVGGLWTLRALQAIFNQGASTSFEQRLGPLPAGRYTVRATTADGRSAERTVRLRGRGEEKRVRVELDEG